MLSAYINVTKPRMVLGNAIVAAAAFVFASPAEFNWPGFVYMFAGIWLIMSSACAVNNYYDRDIDARMSRTRTRALPAGRIVPTHALAIGAVTVTVGSVLLNLVSPLAMWIGLVGWIFYALIYTPMKHRTGLALYAGAVAGAIPPVVGYAAAAGRLDIWAGLLFAVLYLWQLPHFIAIAYFRYEEYTAAGVPLLVSRPGENRRKQARKVFYLSLVVLLLFSLALILHRWIR
ncbi:MAG: protoheme farnesyltransferase [Candidatus Adlerbacteria bacterium]|nr:protoheme farnesyltransferase [Candidatus Adlerbacteria bacterium]